MKKIEMGHTNNVFKDGDKTVIKKTYTGFNHKIDYSLLSEFDFVPKLISNTHDELIFEWIEGETKNKYSHAELKKIAIQMRKIHTSDVKFPKNNLRQRVKQYIKTIHDKYLKIPEIEDNWKEMNKLITQMSNLNPLHNDLWSQNIIIQKDKIYFIDWEYATMGDKHFDLAYFIESNYLSKEDEKVFLQAYNDTEDFWAYIPEWMEKYKMFVCWLTIAWAHSQEKMPFPLDELKAKIRERAKLIKK